jgi:HSP90 family molecular chaperone
MKNISESSLENAKTKNKDKNKPIIDETNKWLQANIEDIRIKHKVSNVNVRVKFVIISNLGILQRATEKDVCDIASTDKKRGVTFWAIVHQEDSEPGY